MLADEILAAVNSPVDRVYTGAISALGIAIRQAKRFDLAPGVIVTANTVSSSSITAQLRALPLCRLPFEFVWMEWPGADPVYDAFQENNATAAAPRPHRMGVLIHTDESRQKGSMTFAWSHRQHGINACPLACFFDWRADGAKVEDVIHDLFRQSGRTEDDLRRTIIEQDRSLPQMKGSSESDVINSRSRFGFNISPGIVTLISCGRHRAGAVQPRRSCCALDACLLVPDFESIRPDHTIGMGCKSVSTWTEVTVDERMS
jgi:hypothetical protein